MRLYVPEPVISKHFSWVSTTDLEQMFQRLSGESARASALSTLSLLMVHKREMQVAWGLTRTCETKRHTAEAAMLLVNSIWTDH